MNIAVTDKLSFKQAKLAVLIAFALGVILGLTQVSLDFKQEKSKMDVTISQVLSTVRDSASHAVYSLDTQLGNRVISGLFEYTPIVYVEILDDFGKTLVASDRKEVMVRGNWVGDLFLGGEDSTYELDLFVKGETNSIGKLKIKALPIIFFKDFFDRITLILVLGIFRNLLLAAFLAVAFYFLLTKRLEQITKFVSSLDPRIPETSRMGVPKDHMRDEIGVLIMSINQHLDDWMEAENAHKASDIRHRSLIDSSPVCIHEIDLDGKLISMNPAGLTMMGVEDEMAVCGMRYLDVSIPEDRERISDLMERARKGEGSSFEFTATGETGPLHFSSSFEPIWDNDGNVIRLMGVTQDITRRTQAVASLRESEENIRTTLNSIGDAVIATDTFGNVTRINPVAEKLTGWSSSEVRGRPVTDIFHIVSAETRAAALNPVKTVLETGEIVELANHTILVARDQSEYQIADSAAPIRSDAGDINGVVLVFRDITEEYEIKENLRNALVDAEQANQAKSEFLATMSHELRTPLNAILGFSEILGEQYFGPPGEGKYREYAKDIHKSGELLLELVNDLLDISAIEAGKTSLDKESLRFEEIVDDCIRIVIERARSKGIELTTDVTEDLPVFHGDRRAIKQIFLNLISNSIKFTPDGGKVSILVKGTGEETQIVIADTGKGISAERLSEITSPFTRGESDPYVTDRGWGLGLSIAKSLVELHDGELNIESEVGEGTIVIVTLPSRVAKT